MRNIEDLEHFVLAEGETLILRCKRPLADDELAYMRKCIDRFLPGRPVLVLPPDIEVCAGKLEVWGAETEDTDDTEEREQAWRDTLHNRYANGRLFYARDSDGEVFAVQKVAFPHTIDFDRYTYALTEKELRQ